MSKRAFAPITLLVAAAVFVMGAIFTIPGLSAQGTPDVMDAAWETPHPAHIHSGTCDTLGDVVFPLSDVSAPPEGTPAAMASPEGSMMSTPAMGSGMDMGSPAASDAGAGGKVVAWSTTDVDASLDDILGAEHAINVHESKENIGNYIACGDLTGETTNGTLTVELKELNGSGYSGQAVLTDNGDGTTTVEVSLVHSGDSGTPVASPAS